MKITSYLSQPKMSRALQTKLHAATGTLSLVLILAFFTSTVAVEMGGTLESIAAVKRYIAYSLMLLVPLMAAAGITGVLLSGRSQATPIVVKKRRMKIIGANGLLVLVPCALTLHFMAQAGSFKTGFYVIQSVELIAGPVNIVLLSINLWDGLKLSGRLRRG